MIFLQCVLDNLPKPRIMLDGAFGNLAPNSTNEQERNLLQLLHIRYNLMVF